MRGLLLVLLMLPSLAVAEGRVMLGAHEQDEWRAVGRLNTGSGFCTATLVAPDLVVTAAHCLYARRTGVRLRAERVHFVAGYRLRKFAGHARAERLTVHPEYQYAQRVNAKGVSTDLALVKLSGPITATPFAVAPDVRVGDPIVILSYGRDRPEIPSIQSPCHVIRRVGGVLVMDCDVTYGVSGAPVFRRMGGEWRIVAVVSAMGTEKGRNVAYAVALDQAMGAVLAAP
ncbi:MAG: trypsin-like serine peptidase [Pikeienuella sp.]